MVKMRNRFNENNKIRLWLTTGVWLNFAFCGSYLLAKLYAAVMQYLGAPLTEVVYPYFFACLVLPAYFDITKRELQLSKRTENQEKTKANHE
ncbi:MAG: hypothetical protein DI620_01740 [Haemophilus parainfluenzae]|nr:MAG: hypothetical protein DI620_01740 [Haemophilus parainfluenzae]